MGQFIYMKHVLLAGAATIVVLSIVYFGLSPKPHTTVTTIDDSGMADHRVPPTEPGTLPDTPTSSDRIARPETPTTPAGGKIKAANFTGTLQSVNTGCFSDGECFVTIDGKHVTVLMGWSHETVGSIIGAPSIGDLEAYVGKRVEVYAKDNMDGTYTLYGSEGFYVKVVSDTGTTTQPTTISSDDSGACVVGGCSNQLCTDATAGPAVSNCMYSPQYACYKTAKCERQAATGKCGWTETATLKACLVSNQQQPVDAPQ
jgi:hypothetical protein